MQQFLFPSFFLHSRRQPKVQAERTVLLSPGLQAPLERRGRHAQASRQRPAASQGGAATPASLQGAQPPTGPPDEGERPTTAARVRASDEGDRPTGRRVEAASRRGGGGSTATSRRTVGGGSTTRCVSRSTKVEEVMC
jgi:hypothetical protein